MRTLAFKQVLRQCAQSQNVNPDSGSYTAEYAAELAESIGNWCSQLWTQEWWPFLLLTQRRQFRASYDAGTTYAAGDERYYDEAYYRSMAAANTGNTPGTDEAWWMEVLSITSDDVTDYVWDPFIALDSSGETAIPEDGYEVDEFMYFESPVVNRWARPMRHLREDSSGIHVTDLRYPVRPWIRFRPAPPQFTAALFVSGTSYDLGDVRYDAATGECYVSLADANTGAVTDTSKWTKQLFPAVFLAVIRLFARAERMGMDEKYDAESRCTTRADALVEKLVDDFFESGGRTRRARVVGA